LAPGHIQRPANIEQTREVSMLTLTEQETLVVSKLLNKAYRKLLEDIYEKKKYSVEASKEIIELISELEKLLNIHPELSQKVEL
jgi:hypothetical protein